MDRRHFMKTTTAAVGTLSFVGQPRFARAQPVGRDPIRIGLIGCGGRGTGAALQALSTDQDVQLVAMADAFADKVESSYQTLTTLEDMDLTPRIDVPPERRYSGFDAYQQVIPQVDVVILTTPPGFRPIHFEAAVDAGKHIFMEKPVATDSPGIRSVLENAERAKADGLNVVVGLQRHYQTIYREWVDRLHAGMIGDIVLGRVYWNSGGVWVRERQPGQTEPRRQRGHPH
ncbi:MAG: Gfo/Idh/MocA family oxidoreductase, partial [Gemmatimonadetes bacterium]|nr:Gfo/Idh/MocA family oxidoreductase [Gemmatimonadota bacterium]